MTAWLSLSIWVPCVAGLLVLAFQRTIWVRQVATVGAIAGFLVTFPLLFGFARTSAMQFEEVLSWIPHYNINYHLGVDGLSLPFIVLNSFITVLVVLAAWQSVRDRLPSYLACFLIMSGLLNGVFSALDAILFYVFFEASLIPMFLIIGMWGGANRIYASFKFFLYTLLGSFLMLVALLFLFSQSGTFEILQWQQMPLALTAQSLIFFAFLAAFAVKVPMWPVHTWLPDAHVEAPTGGSVVLAAIMLKLGAYGLIRLSLPILPDASHQYAWLIIALSLVAVVYIGLVAIVQQDMKKLIAYSSVAHMGFVTLGIFLFSPLGMQGALVQMFSHGLISGALFFCVGVLYERVHSRQINDYGGVVNTMPRYAALFMFFALANAGLPGTSGFIGEFQVILASAKLSFWVAALAALSLILGAAYSLWMYKRTIFGPVANSTVAALKDLTAIELFILALLALLVLALGVYPLPLTNLMEPSVEHLISQVNASKLVRLLP